MVVVVVVARHLADVKDHTFTIFDGFIQTFGDLWPLILSYSFSYYFESKQLLFNTGTTSD